MKGLRLSKLPSTPSTRPAAFGCIRIDVGRCFEALAMAGSPCMAMA